MGQVPLQGQLALNLHAATEGDTTTLAADGTVGVTGGQPQASALVGDDGRIEPCRDAARQRSDPVDACGSPGAPPPGGQRAGRRRTGSTWHWSLAVSDLAAAEPHLGGQLQATGTVAGATDDLA